MPYAVDLFVSLGTFVALFFGGWRVVAVYTARITGKLGQQTSEIDRLRDAVSRNGNEIERLRDRVDKHLDQGHAGAAPA